MGGTHPHLIVNIYFRENVPFITMFRLNYTNENACTVHYAPPFSIFPLYPASIGSIPWENSYPCFQSSECYRNVYHIILQHSISEKIAQVQGRALFTEFDIRALENLVFHNESFLEDVKSIRPMQVHTRDTPKSTLELMANEQVAPRMIVPEIYFHSIGTKIKYDRILEADAAINRLGNFSEIFQLQHCIYEGIESPFKNKEVSTAQEQCHDLIDKSLQDSLESIDISPISSFVENTNSSNALQYIGHKYPLDGGIKYSTFNERDNLSFCGEFNTGKYLTMLNEMSKPTIQPDTSESMKKTVFVIRYPLDNASELSETKACTAEAPHSLDESEMNLSSQLETIVFEGGDTVDSFLERDFVFPRFVSDDILNTWVFESQILKSDLYGRAISLLHINYIQISNQLYPLLQKREALSIYNECLLLGAEAQLCGEMKVLPLPTLPLNDINIPERWLDGVYFSRSTETKEYSHEKVGIQECFSSCLLDFAKSFNSLPEEATSWMYLHKWESSELDTLCAPFVHKYVTDTVSASTMLSQDRSGGNASFLFHEDTYSENLEYGAIQFWNRTLRTEANSLKDIFSFLESTLDLMAGIRSAIFVAHRKEDISNDSMGAEIEDLFLRLEDVNKREIDTQEQSKVNLDDVCTERSFTGVKVLDDVLNQILQLCTCVERTDGTCTSISIVYSPCFRVWQFISTFLHLLCKVCSQLVLFIVPGERNSRFVFDVLRSSLESTYHVSRLSKSSRHAYNSIKTPAIILATPEDAADALCSCEMDWITSLSLIMYGPYAGFNWGAYFRKFTQELSTQYSVCCPVFHFALFESRKMLENTDKVYCIRCPKPENHSKSSEGSYNCAPGFNKLYCDVESEDIDFIDTLTKLKKGINTIYDDCKDYREFPAHAPRHVHNSSHLPIDSTISIQWLKDTNTRNLTLPVNRTLLLYLHVFVLFYETIYSLGREEGVVLWEKLEHHHWSSILNVKSFTAFHYCERYGISSVLESLRKYLFSKKRYEKLVKQEVVGRWIRDRCLFSEVSRTHFLSSIETASSRSLKTFGYRTQFYEHLTLIAVSRDANLHAVRRIFNGLAVVRINSLDETLRNQKSNTLYPTHILVVIYDFLESDYHPLGFFLNLPSYCAFEQGKTFHPAVQNENLLYTQFIYPRTIIPSYTERCSIHRALLEYDMAFSFRTRNSEHPEVSTSSPTPVFSPRNFEHSTNELSLSEESSSCLASYFGSRDHLDIIFISAKCMERFPSLSHVFRLVPPGDKTTGEDMNINTISHGVVHSADSHHPADLILSPTHGVLLLDSGILNSQEAGTLENNVLTLCRQFLIVSVLLLSIREREVESRLQFLNVTSEIRVLSLPTLFDVTNTVLKFHMACEDMIRRPVRVFFQNFTHDNFIHSLPLLPECVTFLACLPSFHLGTAMLVCFTVFGDEVLSLHQDISVALFLLLLRKRLEKSTSIDLFNFLTPHAQKALVSLAH